MTDSTERTKITFSQAEGLEPLPSPLGLKEVSQELRAKLWMVVHESLFKSSYSNSWDPRVVVDPWNAILFDHFVLKMHGMADDYSSRYETKNAFVRKIVEKGEYHQIYDFLQFVLRHSKAPYGFDNAVQWALKNSRAAYRIIDGNTIVPISNEQEGNAVSKAFKDLRTNELSGALGHLRKAAELLSAGNDSDSIRESIHAVESVARKIDPRASATLGPALAELEKRGLVHPQLRSGFEKLYNYTNAEAGIRHPLIDDSSSKVDEIDAQFMFGACASFISYLVAKGRAANLIQKA